MLIREFMKMSCSALIIPHSYCIEPFNSKLMKKFPVVNLLRMSPPCSIVLEIVYATFLSSMIGGMLTNTSGFLSSNTSAVIGLKVSALMNISGFRM